MRKWVHMGVLLAATSALFVACGDDDDDGESGAPESAVEADDGEAAGEDGDFCTAYLDLIDGDPTPERIREVAAVAPPEAAEALEAAAAGFEEQGEAYFEDEAFTEHYATMGAVAADECADVTLEVTATEYAFDGIPESVEPGVVALTFSNEGAEFHELIVFGRAEGVTESFDELLELEEDEAEGKLVELGGTFAEPGGSAPGLLDLTEPGDYIAVCFVPVGSTPDAEGESEGPPHMTQGMRAEFTVAA